MKTKPSNTAGLIGAIMLFVLGLGPGAAMALELGPADIRSSLGERLLVEIPLAQAGLAAPECFSGSVSGFRQPLGLRKLGDRLLLSTPGIIREPMLDLTVTVSCPNVVRLERSYTLFIDPPTREAATRPAPFSAARADDAGMAAQTETSRSLPAPGARYTVRNGDTVSQIAAAMAGDGKSIWPIVERIVADNPQAFIAGDPDRLMADATLVLATAVSTQPTPAAATPVAERTPAPSTPPQPAPAAASVAAETAQAAPAATQADKLLALLQARETEAAQLPEQTRSVGQASPFKSAAQDSAATPVIPPVTDIADEPSVAHTPWLTRLIALAGGMLLALFGWIGWEVASGRAARQRRQQERSAPIRDVLNDELTRTQRLSKSRPAAPVADSTDVLPAANLEPQEAGYEVAFIDDDEDDTFSFHNPDAAATRQRPVAIESPAQENADVAKAQPPQNDDLEVRALEDIGMTTIMRNLDEETQKLLERDYEGELTHTQQLNKDVAERALALKAGARGYEPTEEMPLIDESEMLDADDNGLEDVTAQLDGVTAELDGVTEAQFVHDSRDENATQPMSLDLDFDDPSVSAVLRESADMLAESLMEMDEEEDEKPQVPAKRQA